MPKINISNHARGYLIGAIAAATYGLNPLFALPCYELGMNAESVLLLRYALAIVVIGSMVRLRGHRFAIERRQALPVVAMGFLMALSSLSLFMAYNYMASGVASTLLFVYPVMVAVIMALFFKEKVNVFMVTAVGLSLAGILMLYRGEGDTTLSPLGTALVMMSALTYAIYIVGVNRRPLDTLPSLKLTFWCLVVGTAVIATRFMSVPFTPPRGLAWLNIAGLALLPTALSFLCTTRSIQLIGSTPTAILGALEPITALLIGVAVFGETLGVREIMGIIMILVAVTIVITSGSLPGLLMRARRMFPRGIHKLFGKKK